MCLAWLRMLIEQCTGSYCTTSTSQSCIACVEIVGGLKNASATFLRRYGLSIYDLSIYDLSIYDLSSYGPSSYGLEERLRYVPELLLRA